MRHYLFSDTETAGLTPANYSLLESAFVLAGPDRKELFACQFYHKRERYSVSAGALKINKLDLVEVHSKGIAHDGTLESAREIPQLQELIERLQILRFHKHEIVLACHNVPFDLPFLLKEFPWLRSENFDENLISYRTLDTIGVAIAAEDAGLIQPKNLKLETLAPYFNIEHKAHTALSDARACLHVYDHLIQLIRGKAA